MADANSSSNNEEIRNGFKMLNRLDIECHSTITMDNSEKIGNLLEAIKRLATHDPAIVGLAENAKSLADGICNDADEIHERAAKAGLIGYKVETEYA